MYINYLNVKLYQIPITKMTPILYEWLRKMFYKDNHPKYRHLFERWVQNLTWNQILGFEKQMYNYENKVL